MRKLHGKILTTIICLYDNSYTLGKRKKWNKQDTHIAIEDYIHGFYDFIFSESSFGIDNLFYLLFA